MIIKRLKDKPMRCEECNKKQHTLYAIKLFPYHKIKQQIKLACDNCRYAMEWEYVIDENTVEYKEKPWDRREQIFSTKWIKDNVKYNIIITEER
jgi:hypothetical protein